MPSVNHRIRSALEARLSSITGIPDIAWENVKYSPTTGQSFVQPLFLPTQQRPSVRGLNPVLRYQGIFSVNCFVPEGNGPGAADDLANLIIDNFPATDSIYYSIPDDALLTEAEAFIVTESGARVLVDDVIHVSLEFSERQQGVLRSPWYMVTVDVDWYSYK
jgi:hypothetical protein